MVRTTLRRLARPVLSPLLPRLDTRLGHLLLPVWDALRRLEHRADALEASTTALFEEARRQGQGSSAAPLLLDAVATQHAALRGAARRDQDLWSAVDRDGRRLDEVEHRMEVVRREVLFELRYGRQDTGPVRAATEPKILDQAKVDAMGDRLRLNVGSGSLAVEGYLNVDRREIVGVDILAEVGDLPFDDGSIEEVRSAHVLEHFPEEELRRRVLPHWVAKLRPGGTMRAVVPDALSMIEACSKGALRFEDLREVTFGAQDYEGDFHFTMFSIGSLTTLLEGAGLAEVEIVEAGRRNGLCLEMELVARKPEDPERVERA